MVAEEEGSTPKSKVRALEEQVAEKLMMQDCLSDGDYNTIAVRIEQKEPRNVAQIINYRKKVLRKLSETVNEFQEWGIFDAEEVDTFVKYKRESGLPADVLRLFCIHLLNDDKKAQLKKEEFKPLEKWFKKIKTKK